jgi:hypothetical protein
MVDTMVPEKKWTDGRLDDLSTKVDAGFARADKKMDAGFARADEKMDAGFARVDGDFRELKDEMNERFEKVEGKIEGLDSKFDKKFDGLNNTLLGSAVSIVVTLLVCCATLIGIAVL